MDRLTHLRNIGISAHIDSGKTTLTERILFYTGRIHKMVEVKDKSGGGATMDSMELERERGITIQSAATFCDWKCADEDYHINIIDTPGHVDFTIEVERALSVLDGAVLVLCAASGVQSQSLTVDRQMRRYNVPRIAFINKMDLGAADFFAVVEQLRTKLRHVPAVLQCPIGAGDDFAGVIDLLQMKAMYNRGDNGETREYADIPDEYKEKCEAMREQLIETLADFDEELAMKYLDGEEISIEELNASLRRATIARDVTPVMCGSAYRNKGVQALLDAVVRYLPNPSEVTNQAFHQVKGEETQVELATDSEKPLCALAFKLDDTAYGQLTYIRVYQGKVEKGGFIFNNRTSKKHKVGRLVRLHADQLDEVEVAGAGQIVALFGIDCASGDTFHGADEAYSMQTMHVPEPVISLAIDVADKRHEGNLSKALGRFTKEDPTFRVERDDETNETIISGMGELHIDVYVERIRREYNVPVVVGQPRVRYREAITQVVEFNYTHKKQTGGKGQYAKIMGTFEPLEDAEFEFVETIVGGAIPKEYLKAVEAGFKEGLKEGKLIHAPIVGLKATINDGNTHEVDSSERAFKIAAKGCLRENYEKGKPVVLEPLMAVEIEVPEEFQGRVLGDITRRRGRVTNTRVTMDVSIIEAEVPLAEMFSYSNDLRSATEGKGQFSMEFGRYDRCPMSVQEELVAKAQKKPAGAKA